jgi:hypothetical protein
MDEKMTVEELEYFKHFLYNFIDMCEVVGNLSSDLKEEAKAFVDKLEAFYKEKNGETKKVNLYQLRNLIEGKVALEIKHREPERIIEADITLIPEGMYCYDEKHVCPYRKRLYYTDPLNSLIECKYLGVIIEDDPCFGDEVKICEVRDGIE